jgi:hypothetical protein
MKNLKRNLVSIILLLSLSVYSQEKEFKYQSIEKDFTIEIAYERGYVGYLDIRRSGLLTSDTISYFFGTKPGANDLCSYSQTLGKYEAAPLSDVGYAWYGMIDCKVNSFNFLTVQIKRNGQILYNRVLPFSTLNYIQEDSYNDLICIKENLLTNVSNFKLNIDSYDYEGKKIKDAITLLPNNDAETCSKCILIVTSSNGIQKRIKL